MKKINIFILSFFISLVALAQTEIKGSPDELINFLHPVGNTVVLYAEAEEKAPADKALFTLEINSKSKQFSEAIKQNKQIRQQISQNLLQSGINANDIKNARFSTSKENAWIGQKDNYAVDHRMTITLANDSQLEILAKMIDLFSEVQLVDIHFIHSNKEEFENQVRAKALEKVLQQKSFYEKKLNVSLEPLNFHQSPIYLPVIKANQALNQSPALHSNLKNEIKPSFDEQIYRSQIEVEFKVK